MKFKTENFKTDFKSLRDQVSPAEWQARLDLAACYRLVDAYDMTDLIYNHITARIPGSPDHILINPYGMMYEEVTASSLIKIDLDGNIVGEHDPHFGINAAGYVIHSAVHAARHDVQCVLHTHTRAGSAVSAMKRGLIPLAQTSMRFARIASACFFVTPTSVSVFCWRLPLTNTTSYIMRNFLSPTFLRYPKDVPPTGSRRAAYSPLGPGMLRALSS